MNDQSSSLKAGDARFAAVMIAAHEKADPLIAIDERLTDLVSILRTAVIALDNPNICERWGVSDCALALEFATREIDQVRRRAKDQASDILREAS